MPDPEFKLLADDVTMWRGRTFPEQWQIDAAATAANLRGWNGVALDVYVDGEWSETVKPTEGVL